MSSILKIVSGALISLTSLFAGCHPNNYRFQGYSNYTYTPSYQQNLPQQNCPDNPYLWQRNPAYSNPYSNNIPHNPERQAWRENAYTPRTTFRDAGRVEQHIRDETRGADFNNPIDRRDAEIRAQQIREEAWRRQTKEWNKELERRGYTRKRN